MHLGKNDSLSYATFEQLVISIDPHLTAEEIKHTFTKLNESGSGKISYQEFERGIQKFGIHMSVKHLLPETKPEAKTLVGYAEENDIPFRQQTNLKIANALTSLGQFLASKKMSVYQLFETYKVSEKKLIDINDYDMIMLKLNSTFTEREIELGYSLIDKRGNKQVPFEEFLAYFTSALAHIHSPQLKKKESSSSDTSITIPVQSPPNYNQHGNLLQQQQQQQQQHYQQQQQQQQLSQQQQQYYQQQQQQHYQQQQQQFSQQQMLLQQHKQHQMLAQQR